MGDKVELHLVSPAGEDIVELNDDLWARVEAKARQLRVQPEDLVRFALSEYIESQKEGK